MPTYDYECPKGHRFEVFQKMTDEPVSECPECGAAATRLISGGAGFLFKGDGFYITDYRSEEYKKQASKEGSGGSSSETAAKPAGDSASKRSTKSDGGSSGGSKASSDT